MSFKPNVFAVANEIEVYGVWYALWHYGWKNAWTIFVATRINAFDIDKCASAYIKLGGK